jgi:hypothetical protein
LRWQELLIRCLARSGDRAGAELQLAACEELCMRELGMPPGPELGMAAREGEGTAIGAAGDPAAALGQLEAGRAALDAGAVQPGLDCLRLACGEAAACGDAGLRALTLVALGSALVHAVRGRDGEGAAGLHEALAVAEYANERASAELRAGSWATSTCRPVGTRPAVAGLSRRPSWRHPTSSGPRSWDSWHGAI